MTAKNKEKQPNQPIDISDTGIADAVSSPGRKRLAIILCIYAVWLGFLMYCIVAGGGTEL